MGQTQLTGIPWQGLLTEHLEDGTQFILGWQDGWWKCTRRQRRGLPIPFEDGTTVHRVCPGPLEDDIAEAVLEYNGGTLFVTLPTVEGCSDYCSFDGGETWLEG
jgi:hypothetical protein